MGSSPESGFVAAPCLVEFPHAAAQRENYENVVGASSRILPDLDTHGSIRETLLRHPFPICQRNPAMRPIADRSLPVLLLVPAGHRESRHFGKQATSETQKSGPTDPKSSRRCSLLRPAVNYRWLRHISRPGPLQTWTTPGR